MKARLMTPCGVDSPQMPENEQIMKAGWCRERQECDFGETNLGFAVNWALPWL